MYVLYMLYVRIIHILRILRTTLYDFSYYSSSHGSIGSIMAYATSTNSSSSALSSCDTCLIRSVTRRVSPNKTLETWLIRLNIWSICLNYNTYIYFSVPSSPTQYRRIILYDIYIIYILVGRKPIINLFIYLPFKSLLSTAFKGLLSTRLYYYLIA